MVRKKEPNVVCVYCIGQVRVLGVEYCRFIGAIFRWREFIVLKYGAVALNSSGEVLRCHKDLKYGPVARTKKCGARPALLTTNFLVRLYYLRTGSLQLFTEFLQIKDKTVNGIQTEWSS